MIASLIAALTLVVTLAASCTGTQTEEVPPSSSPATGADTPSPEATPSAHPVTDYSSFKQAMETAGFTVLPGGRTGLPASLLAVHGQQVLIDGVTASLFEYPTERALDVVRSAIAPRGDEIPTADGGTAIINWDPPHFYGSGKLLVLYFGDRQRALEALETLLGPQFAGGGT
jgi:hypothetical protein